MLNWDIPCGLAVKNPSAMQEPQEMRVLSLGQEDSLEEEMATHSIILSWRIPWTEKSGRLQVHGVTKSQSTEQTHTHALYPAFLTWKHGFANQQYVIHLL